MRRPAVGRLPDEAFVAAIAKNATGRTATAITRFTTGSSHYVFEAAFSGRRPVVVRIGGRSAQAEMAGASRLSALLRPQGVPLPAILAEDIGTEPPWLVLERLPGTDLGAVIAGLSGSQLDRIAAGVASAQAITARCGSAGRYGYAVTPEQAPHHRWSQVLEDNLARSQKRLASAGLFSPDLVDSVRRVLAEKCAEVDRIPATPFLHDTTTKNVIVAPDGTLSGIVDVDDLCFGDPRYPAALTLAVLAAYGGPAGYVSAWLGHAGQRDDPVFRLYVAVFLLDLMGEHGQVFNGNERSSTPEARRSLRKAFDATCRLL